MEKCSGIRAYVAVRATPVHWNAGLNLAVVLALLSLPFLLFLQDHTHYGTQTAADMCFTTWQEPESWGLAHGFVHNA
eukprot:11161140-Lingulodinium_polyedra.AAC.1